MDTDISRQFFQLTCVDRWRVCVYIVAQAAREVAAQLQLSALGGRPGASDGCGGHWGRSPQIHRPIGRLYHVRARQVTSQEGRYV